MVGDAPFDHARVVVHVEHDDRIGGHLASQALGKGPIAQLAQARDAGVAVSESPGRLPDVLVGKATLAADGSFHLKVPADVPLRVVTRNGDGEAVLDSGHAFWVRPGERRACIGCHEDRETAPSNRMPEALHRDADLRLPGRERGTLTCEQGDVFGPRPASGAA